MAIRILDERLTNKIAAGEVIERPANVVKELLENSFDAGATQVKIDISGGGINKIRISDNGSGMGEDDVLLSAKRHATSKIKNEEDLLKINSLGFRGEALASIAEVSSLTIISKREEDAVGTDLEIEGGEVQKLTPVACNTGTTIEVRDLFFNVPARREYLKSKEVEFARIVRVISKYSLIRKDVSIILKHDNREIINSQITASQLNNIISIYGVEVGKNLIEVNKVINEIKIEGFISRPSLTRAEKSDQSLYLNGRLIKNKIIEDAVYEGYKTLLFTGRHPIFVLNVLMNPEQVDVNVHPSKELVRLKNEAVVSEAVSQAIKDSLMKENLIVEVEVGEGKVEAKPVKKYSLLNEQQTNLFDGSKAISSVRKVEEEKASYDEVLFGDFRILGQINKTFIICESADGLVILDQHAAEERVNYERFLFELKDGAVKKQRLLESRVLDLNPEQKLMAMNNQSFLNKIGFEFEDFGNNSLKIATIPEIFGRLKTTIFIDILNEILRDKEEIVSKEIEDRIIRFSCRASVKAGDELTRDEIRVLFKNLGRCKNSYSCPHGRPTIIKMTISELEKKFKRTGW